MRLVLDSNLIFSAVLKPTSTPGAVLGAWRAGHFEWITCQEQLDELGIALSRPYLTARIVQADKTVELLIAEMRDTCNLKILVRPLPPICRDPREDHLFALVDQGHADFIISGDKDVLALKGSYPVLTPRELIDRL